MKKLTKLTEEQKQLVEDNTSHVISIANRYMRNNFVKIQAKKMTDDDIKQIALERSCVLASKYRCENDAKFSTYLYEILGFEINRAVDAYNIVKIPRPEHWTSDFNKGYRDDYSLVANKGIGELDVPVVSFGNDGTSSDSFLLDSLEGDSFNGSFEDIWIDDMLSCHLNKRDIEAMKLYIMGYTPLEISQKLNIKRTTLVNRLYKARTKIAKAIETYGYLPEYI